MKGCKKLSKYFKDEKYSLVEKKEAWLLCNNNQEIIWIIGKRQDSRFYASTESETTIQINLNIE